MKAPGTEKPSRIRPAKPGVTPRTPKVEPESAYDWIMRLVERADKIPPEAWIDMPDDASKHVDHYLCGSPKVPD